MTCHVHRKYVYVSANHNTIFFLPAALQQWSVCSDHSALCVPAPTNRRQHWEKKGEGMEKQISNFVSLVYYNNKTNTDILVCREQPASISRQKM